MNNIKNNINLTEKKSLNDLNEKFNIDTNNSLKKLNDDTNKLPQERSGFSVPQNKDNNVDSIQQVKKVDFTKDNIEKNNDNKEIISNKINESVKIQTDILNPLINMKNDKGSIHSKSKPNVILDKKEQATTSGLLQKNSNTGVLGSKKEVMKELTKINAIGVKGSEQNTILNVEKKVEPVVAKNPFGPTVEPKKEIVKEVVKPIENKEKKVEPAVAKKSIGPTVESKKEIVKEVVKPIENKEKKVEPVVTKNPFGPTVELKKEIVKEAVKPIENKEKKVESVVAKNPFGPTVESKKEIVKEAVKPIENKEKKVESVVAKNPFGPTVELKKEIVKEAVKPIENKDIKVEPVVLKKLFDDSLEVKKEEIKEPLKENVDEIKKNESSLLKSLFGVSSNNKETNFKDNSKISLSSEKKVDKESKVLKSEMKKTSTDFVDKVVDEKIDNIKNNTNSFGIGYVTKVKDFILEVSGLDDVSFFEKVEIKGKAIGYVTAIKSNKVIVAILKEEKNILVGDIVTQTNEEFKGAFSENAFGRVIDIFGNDKLVNKKFEQLFKLPVETPNISIMDRSSVNRPLQTGIIGIDFIYPIGKGQRQLIIGDKKIGKTQICLDTIVNQRDKDMLCIYIAIGKTKKEVKEIFYELTRKGAIQNTIILAAFNDEKPPVLSLTPYFGLSIAQYYLNMKKDVLVVIDDLKRHADAYREISLISGKTPGRDAYPSDIFYEHSRLLEKGCQHKNGGSITILPIVETKGGDITDYISTNIISITDGQIVLSEKSFKKGEKPAINYGLSVSRLGGAVQTPNAKKMGATIRRKLLSYLETREVYELANFDEMSPELQEKMKSGKKIVELLTQYKFSPLTESEIMERFKFINEENL